MLKADGGFLAFLVAFSDEPGPHGIVEFRRFTHDAEL
jgi:hypothetical protein